MFDLNFNENDFEALAPNGKFVIFNNFFRISNFCFIVFVQ